MRDQRRQAGTDEYEWQIRQFIGKGDDESGKSVIDFYSKNFALHFIVACGASFETLKTNDLRLSLDVSITI